MSYISFLGGLLIGVWISAYAFNRYYQSDLWGAEKKLRLRRYRVEEAKLDSEIAKHELSIDRMLNERIAPPKPKGPTWRFTKG